ncbi:MAG: spore cortex biosynthesis protein YabQ [Oscillospiraceae bacterium]|nr:spore cortex biosynthesis protein YabQ [Oscillospiraceae bacterium]
MTGLEGQNPSSALQAELFLRSMLLGLPAGLLLDCFRTLRALLPHHALLVFIEDTVYVFLCIFTVQCYVWMYAGGVFRWQYAAGACIGLAVYLATVGAVWMRMLRRLRCAVRRVLRFTGKMLMKPLTCVFQKNLKKYLTGRRFWVYNMVKHRKMHRSTPNRNGAQYGTEQGNGARTRKTAETRYF